LTLSEKQTLRELTCMVVEHMVEVRLDEERQQKHFAAFLHN